MPSSQSQKWTKKACLEMIRRAAVNGVLSYKDGQAHAISLPTMASRRFGSWATACEAAGVKSASMAKKRHVNCAVDGCGSAVRSSGCEFCEKHYMRNRRTGDPHGRKPRPRYSHSNGYVQVRSPGHPLVKDGRPIEYEHRIVFYDTHGQGPFRCLWCECEVTWSDMHIDHLNDDRTDNRAENLAASCPTCNQARGRGKMKRTMQQKHGRWIEWNGQRRLIQDWARMLGINRNALANRLEKWPLERAMTEKRGGSGPKPTQHNRKTVLEDGGFGNPRRTK